MKISGRLDLTVNSSTPAAQTWAGGKGVFMATATWSAGSVKLQTQLPDAAGTWVDVKNQAGTAVSLGADGMVCFELPPGQIKCVIATSTAVYAYAVGLHQ